jgi:hypothetical protein
MADHTIMINGLKYGVPSNKYDFKKSLVRMIRISWENSVGNITRLNIFVFPGFSKKTSREGARGVLAFREPLYPVFKSLLAIYSLS